MGWSLTSRSPALQPSEQLSGLLRLYSARDSAGKLGDFGPNGVPALNLRGFTCPA